MSNRPSHIRLNSHPGAGTVSRFPIEWGAATARERGPVVGTVNSGSDRNAIGAHGGAYSVSKAALAMLTRQAAVEYAAQGIRVNGIMPGVTATPILDEVPRETMDAIIAGIPQKRLASPDEIAAMVAFLASDEAAYVNGALIPVDGASSA